MTMVPSIRSVWEIAPIGVPVVGIMMGPS